jgi:DNA-binding CsgD family transcriptional regulator
VKKLRTMQNPAEQNKINGVEDSNTFVFCEKATGLTQFRAESDANQSITVERVAGLLAMQCLVRGHDPDDFVVLVPAEKNLVGRFLSRAKELLEQGRAVSRPTSLSPRQTEILLSVIRNRANKEIASRLNITVRTVKFHISSLLNKFGVDNRGDLARRAAALVKPGVVDTEGLAFRPPAETMEPADPEPIELERSPSVTMKARGVRFAGRQLSA